MKWITRGRRKIDRIACSCLFARYIGGAPEFLFVPADPVLVQASTRGAIPYVVPAVELTHGDPQRLVEVGTDGKMNDSGHTTTGNANGRSRSCLPPLSDPSPQPVPPLSRSSP